ncbi:hypothetical protein DFJ77DRAFT_442203 [Powellomyces hirtus]|nr:hypothetical protein DFJ77DRAFT_442203 [Powellomyces hirtus]
MSTAPSPSAARTIVFGHDGSAPSASALAFTYSSILRASDTFIVIAVLPWGTDKSKRQDTFAQLSDEETEGDTGKPKRRAHTKHHLGMTPERNQEERQTVYAINQALRHVREVHSIVPANTEIVPKWGEAGPTLCAAAVEYNASILIVGTNGRNKWKGLLMGSVSQYVLTNATVPVVIARPDVPSSKLAKNGSKDNLALHFKQKS